MEAAVRIVPCEDYEDERVLSALREALEADDALDFVKPGMRVGVKLNLVAAMKPEAAATVHPAVVCALTRLLRERGAAVVLGDSPGGLFTLARLKNVYEICGLGRAVDCGAQLNENVAQFEAEFPAGKKARRFPCTAWLREVDAVIDLCKLKTHGMMGLTCAVKNFFGVIPGTIKPEFHYRYPNAADFADVLVDLYEYVRPALCICDAVIGMEGNGPTQGSPRPLGCLLVSRSGHALDAVAAELIGLSPEAVPTLRAAAARGLLPEKTEELPALGDKARFTQPDFKTVPAQSSVFFLILGDGPLGRAADRVARRVMTPFPRLKAARCVGCGKCARLCPAGAITMRRGKPTIRRGRCIHCFCCQEFCPRGAMQVARHWIMRLLGR